MPDAQRPAVEVPEAPQPPGAASPARTAAGDLGDAHQETNAGPTPKPPPTFPTFSETVLPVLSPEEWMPEPPEELARLNEPAKYTPGPYRDKPAGRDRRRQSSISAYIGANGMGKSFWAVHDTLPSLDAGRPVLSTVRLLDHRTGFPHESYVPLTDWAQLLDAEHCDVLLDEIVGIASSRESAGMPVQVANLLVQLRRRDIVVRWTAPAWMRADKIIREVSQTVTLCRGYLSDRDAASAGGYRTQPRLWQPRRLFRARTYSALDFEEWSQAKEGKLRALDSSWMWGPKSRAFASYDTLAPVSRVGEVLDSGRCAHCGGRKVAPRCAC